MVVSRTGVQPRHSQLNRGTCNSTVLSMSLTVKGTVAARLG